jgi:hypothetical protein
MSERRGKFAAFNPNIPSENFGHQSIHISLIFDDIFYVSK